MDGYPAFTYNYLAREVTTLKSKDRLPQGRSTITYSLAYDGGGRGKGGQLLLSRVRKSRVGASKRRFMNPFVVHGTTDVGADLLTHVAQEVFPNAKDSLFQGTIESVTVENQEDEASAA